MIENEEIREFRDVCRRFAENEIAPYVEDAEKTGTYPRELMLRAAKNGFLGLTVSEEFGGGGGTLVHACVMIEEFSRVCAGLATPLLGLGQRLLSSFGTAEQVERYLKPIISGKYLMAFAMTEPGAGSDVLSMRGSATRTDDGWHIKANKIYATGAPMSDFMMVVAYTDRTKRRDGLSIFLVDTKTPGIEIHKMDKLGHSSMETGAVFFDCRVPADALLGDEGHGMKYVMSALEEGRITHAARSLGVARAAYEASLEYAGQRETFGTKINKYQIIQAKLSQMLIDLTTTRLHVYSAAELYESGVPALLEASMAKYVASEAAVSVTDQGMRIFAGAGYINDAPIQRFFRDARLYPISEGTNEIQHRTIARAAGLVDL
ncbi:MAG: acyl-CoA dehydrogenase family protein [Silicimonas sp.]